MARNSAFFKCLAVIALLFPCFLFGKAMLNGVALVVNHLAVLFRPFSGLSKSPVHQRAQAHVTSFLVDGVSQNPRLGSKTADLQIQASAVVIEAGLTQILYSQGCQAVACSAHDLYPPTYVCFLTIYLTIIRWLTALYQARLHEIYIFNRNVLLRRA